MRLSTSVQSVKTVHPPVLLIGAGGHAKVILEEFKSLWNFRAVLSDAPLSRRQTAYFKVHGLDVLIESDAVLDGFLAHGLNHAVVAVGDNDVRLKIAESLLQRGFHVPSLIHPDAQIASTAEVSPTGVQILAGAHVGASAVVGAHTILNHAAIVEHDATLSNAVHVAPQAVVLGGASLATGTLLGCHATVLPNVQVLVKAQIGAGAVVTQNIDQEGVYVGIPAVLWAK